MNTLKNKGMKKLLKNCQTLDGMKDIVIAKDKIIEIYSLENSFRKTGYADSDFDEIIDINGKLVIPGGIDPHVHVRDLNQSDKEDWTSASQAALAGGITTIFDMPNTIPPTTNLHNLALKRKAAKKSLINYKFHLGATNDNLSDLKDIFDKNPTDIAGIKLFLAGSSTNEIITNENKIKELFKLAKRYNKIVLVHTELQKCLDKWDTFTEEKCIQNHNQQRNRECAIKGTKLVLDLAEEIANKLYICHVSTKEEIELIHSAKQINDNIFCEVTPHHLNLENGILDLVGNFGKVNPPLRTTNDNEALWKAVEDGTIDCIGSDHAPHTIDEKIEDYENAPSGFPGLETTLPILITEFNKRNIPIERFVELTSTKTAEIFDIKERGKIEKNYFADLTIINTGNKFPIIASLFHSKAKYSPFDGMEVMGKVEMIFVNGMNIEYRTRNYE